MMLHLLLALSLLLPVKSSGILTKPCVMTKVMASSRPDVWKCLVDGNDYGGRSNHKLEVVGLSNADLSKLVSGVTVMTAIGAEITNRTINIAGVAASFQTPTDRASIASKMGTRTVLAVRVISNDGANPNSAAQLIDNVFTDSVNMVERFASCSYNKLTFQPFSGTLNGKRITDGMYEVQLNVNTKGMDEGRLDEEAIDQLNADLGSDFSDALDHVMIFAPDNVPGFGANAEFDGKFSLYDGFEASFSSVTLVHEIGTLSRQKIEEQNTQLVERRNHLQTGHNLHLDHSSEGDDEYGDDTCSMGFGLNVDDFRVCFNPPKSWALGWYSDKHLSLDVSTAGDVQEHSLVGIAEYDKAGSNSLFIKLENGGNNFFIGFNRAVGINADQIEAVDQVTVTKSAGNSELSFLKAKLSQGESFSIKSIKGTENDVEIRVVSIDTASSPSVARVRISTSQGDGNPSDDDGTTGPDDDDFDDDGFDGGPTLCFSGFNQVNVQERGLIYMSDLQIGDKVQSSNGFSTVYTFLHIDHHTTTSFIRFNTEDARNSLEISPRHYLSVNGTMVAAKDVTIGDVLDGPGPIIVVTSVEHVERPGFYAPATVSGDLIVNGILASSYVTILEASALPEHRIAHAYMAPLRYFSSNWAVSHPHHFYPNHMDSYVYPLVMVAQFLALFPLWIQFAVTAVLVAPIVILVEGIDAASNVLGSEWWVLLVVALLFFTRSSSMYSPLRKGITL